MQSEVVGMVIRERARTTSSDSRSTCAHPRRSSSSPRRTQCRRVTSQELSSRNAFCETERADGSTARIRACEKGGAGMRRLRTAAPLIFPKAPAQSPITPGAPGAALGKTKSIALVWLEAHLHVARSKVNVDLRSSNPGIRHHARTACGPKARVVTSSHDRFWRSSAWYLGFGSTHSPRQPRQRS